MRSISPAVGGRDRRIQDEVCPLPPVDATFHDPIPIGNFETVISCLPGSEAAAPPGVGTRLSGGRVPEGGPAQGFFAGAFAGGLGIQKAGSFCRVSSGT